MSGHLAKALDAIWMISMGLFLGVAATTVLAVVETFDSSRKIDANPGLAPYSDPRFSPQANEVVAGFIGQNLFLVCGTVSLILLGIAVLARAAYRLSPGYCKARKTGSRIVGFISFVALLLCIQFMAIGAFNMKQMRTSWPDLYDTSANQTELDQRRDAFERLHKTSERVVGSAWFLGLLSLSLSPWRRRIIDSPLQSGDGKEEVNQ